MILKIFGLMSALFAAGECTIEVERTLPSQRVDKKIYRSVTKSEEDCVKTSRAHGSIVAGGKSGKVKRKVSHYFKDSK